MRFVLSIILPLLFFMPAEGNIALSDNQIAKTLISQSQNGYSGSCPCPYSLARNGSRCGKRSAYSRPGGAGPLCYPSDITPEMIQEFKRRHQSKE